MSNFKIFIQGLSKLQKQVETLETNTQRWMRDHEVNMALLANVNQLQVLAEMYEVRKF